MLNAMAVITFLLANGAQSTLAVFPPGGDYRPNHAQICERNKPNTEAQVRRLLSEGKISKTDGADKILSIKIMCVASTAA